MNAKTPGPWALLFIAAACVLMPRIVASQGLTGSLIGTVTDAQGGVLPGAIVSLTSPAMIGGSAIFVTDKNGQLRFQTLPPGSYVLKIDLQGFTPHREEDIDIGAGATIDITVVLNLAGFADSVVVEGAGSRIEARNSGFETRWSPDVLTTIPTRRASMFDFIRATPGLSPTSPSSGTITTVSAFGSGTNENQFLIEGTNFTCPCNGVARAEAGADFIQEVQVQAVGASAEFGNVQGAVINVLLRQGGNRFLYEAASYWQTAGLTSQAARLRIPGSDVDSAYKRVSYRDFTTSLGGPVVRDRLWFFGGYQSLRDKDSQPGTVPDLPRRTDSDKVFGKVTWQIAPGWQMVSSFHDEFQDVWGQPTIVLPFDATLRRSASVPAMTLGRLTHTSSSNTGWDVLVGRFVFSQENTPSTGDRATPSRFDSFTGVTSGAPPNFSILRIVRTTAKATVTHYRPGLLAADHQLKGGAQFETAGHNAVNAIPTGVRYIDNNGQPSQSVSAEPDHVGGRFDTASAFATDAVTIKNRMTVNAGIRFDYSRAISQDLPAVDLEGRETASIVQGLGTLYTWNLWSPRLGVTARLSDDGRTMLRGSYGRFNQGVLTGELEAFHPGGTPTTRAGFEQAAGGYTRIVSVVDPKDLRLNPHIRAPHTDVYSIGVDRSIAPRLTVAAAYVRKDGKDFIGWTDIGGEYTETTAVLKDGRTVPVFKLVNKPADRRYLLTNPEGYSLTYNGLVTAVEKRWSQGWQALGSYTFSRAYGLQPSSGTTAAGAQASTVSPPQALTFGRDPNDLINARGRLPNDRPHIFRIMGAVDVPRTSVAIAANFQSFSGKPWAATALINPQDSQQRVLLEPRGAQRLSTQSLLDLRVSMRVAVGSVGRVELVLDVLNALNETAEESIASDDLFNPTFNQPTTFVDPRRAMLGVRLRLGR